MKKSVTIALLLSAVLFVSKANSAFADDATDKLLSDFVYLVPGVSRIEGDNKNKVCFYGYDQLTVGLGDKYKDVVEIKSLDISKVVRVGCRVLYVARDKDRKIKEIAKMTDPVRIITIGLADDFVDNGGVLLLQMGRRNVEVTANHTKVKAFGVKFDPMFSGLVTN